MTPFRPRTCKVWIGKFALSTRPLILFLFGSEPDPVILERAASLHETGRYQIKFAYWSRGEGSSIYYPFAKLLPEDAFLPIRLADPRGGLLRRAWLSARFAWKLSRIVAADQSALKAIYCVNINMCAIASLATLLRRRAVLIHEFQDQFGTRLNFLARFLYRLSARKVALTILQSAASYEYINSNGLKSVSAPAIILPPAPAKWTYEHTARSGADDLKIGYFGYMRGQRILGALIDAAKQVNAGGRKVVLKFAGGGDCADYVRQRAQAEPFIQFSGVYEYYSEYPALFASVDVIFGVFPTSNPTFRRHIARRFAEAVASGMPIIVGKDTYMDGLVAKYGCGWSAAEDSVDELADLLTRIYDRRADLGELRAPAKTRANWKFESRAAEFHQAVAAALPD